MQRCYKILLVYFVLFSACYGAGQSVLPSHLSSKWYHQDPQALRKQLYEIDQAAVIKYPMQTNKVRAMVVPHASLDYSGTLAAACWRLVKNQSIKRVIILAPSHYVPFCGVLLPKYSKLTLPIGSLIVDTDCIHRLSQQLAYFVFSPHSDTQCALKKANLRHRHTAAQQSDFILNPFENDHALEMQLLFCSYYLPNANVVPLIVGTLTRDDAQMVAMHLKDCVDPHTLVVVSSDFIHYGPAYDYQPFPKNDTYAFNQDLKDLTMSLVKPLESASIDRFIQTVQDKQATVCGKNPLMVLLALINKKTWTAPRLVGYDTSDPLNTKADCVSYVGMVWDDGK